MARRVLSLAMRWLLLAIATLTIAAVARADPPPIEEFTAAGNPNAIAAGPDGALWYSEFGAGRIGRVAVDGTVAEYPQTPGPALTAGAHPSGVVAGPDGDIWFTEFGTGQIGRIDPATGQLVGEFPVPSGAGSQPEGIAAGPDGAIWFTEAGAGKIGRLDIAASAPGTSSGMSEFPVARPGSDDSGTPSPVQIATGPDGRLWATIANRATLNRIDPATDTLDFVPLPTANSTPEGIATGPDGALWVSEYGVGKVARVDTSAVVPDDMNNTSGITETATPGFAPLLGTAAFDGHLWFTGPVNGTAILQLDPTAPATQNLFSSGLTGAPNGDGADAAGNVWFTEFSANRVGAVLLAPKPVAGTPALVPATPRQGQLQTCDPDALHWQHGPVFSYRWLLDGAPIAGATGATYTPAAADRTHALSCEVTGTNARGATVATAGPATVLDAAVTPGTPVVTGTARAGETLTCDPDATHWVPGTVTFSYRWLRDGTPIPDATSATHPLGDLDAGHGVTCDVTGTNASGDSAHEAAAPVAVSARVPVAATPAITGTPALGQSLTCNPNATAWLGLPSLSIQWARNGAAIPGATATTYAVAADDAGRALTCVVTGTNAAGSATATSPPVAVPAQPAGTQPGGTPPPPAPEPSLQDTTPHVAGGGRLVLSATGSVIPAGQRAAAYTFTVGTGAGAQVVTCPGALPALSAVVTRPVTTVASVTVTTTAGTAASASTPVTVGRMAIAPLKPGTTPLVREPATTRPLAQQVHTSSAAVDIGDTGMLASQCQPAAGAPPSRTSGRSPNIQSVQPAIQFPQSTAPQLPGCATSLKIGIVEGIGCFTQVGPDNPLGTGEAKLLCGHVGGGATSGGDPKWSVHMSPAIRLMLCQGDAGAFFSPDPGSACPSYNYDLMWQSTQPVGVDGLEIDPVNGARLVFVLAGSGDCTRFAKARSAFLVSADAVVKVGGLPITLHVPKYSNLYAQAQHAGNLLQSDVTCAQTAAGALQNADPSGADCLGSIQIPSVSFDGKLLPQVNGPIDLEVSPDQLGIELGEFSVPQGPLPLPVLPQLPLSGTIKVTLPAVDQAAASVHVELPILQDGGNHGLTGDTAFRIDDGGFHLDDLDIHVPSLAQIGLGRLRDLEFHFTKPSRYETRIGTIDLSDVIDGCVGIHLLIDKGAFQEGDAHYRACGAGGGAPLFGPLFLTQLDAGLTLDPVHIHGHVLLSVGPAVNDRGCGAFGIDGTADLVFGDPWTLDAVAQGSILCQTLGTQRIFHADSDGNVSYGEHLSYAIPDLGAIDYNDFLSARAAIHHPLSGITPGDFLGMQLDASGSLAFHPQVCVDVPLAGRQCAGFDVSAGLTGTAALGFNGSRLVGGLGVCANFSLKAFGQSFGFDVGAGIDDLPDALLADVTGNFIDLYSHVAVLLDGCDVTRWRLLPPPKGFSRAVAHAAQQQQPYTLTLPASGTQDALIGIQGAGGAPSVTVTGPNGAPIQATATGINIEDGALVVRQRATGQTLVEIPHAAAGTYTLTPQAGSAAIRSVETAATLPKPLISTRVTGSGARRVLHYAITAPPGLSVRFAEKVGTATRLLETRLITSARGTVRFSPALGSARRRTIVAQTVRNGLPGATYTVGAYTPGRLRPGRAARIAVRHVRAGWQIAWKPGANATRQQLTVRFIDGEQVLLEAKAGQRRLVVPRSIDGGAQPTAIAIVALRGTARGKAAGLAAVPRRR